MVASSSEWFSAALEYAKAISMGWAGKFTDVFMATLGDASVLSIEDTCAILDLYTDRSNACKVPPSTDEARGDEAAGSPVMHTASSYSKKGTLSSAEPPLSEGVGTKLTKMAFITGPFSGKMKHGAKRYQCIMHCLTSHVATDILYKADHPGLAAR